MTTPPPPSHGRNALCPCGSGRKYKRCCEGRTWTRTETGARKRWLNPFSLMLIVIAVGSLAIWGISGLASGSSGSGGPSESAGASADTASPAPVGQPAAPTTPEPWHYDEANNRHWDPGHGHWHNGPPPPEHLR